MLEPPRRAETVLSSTHNLCFEHKYEKYQNFFISKNFLFLVVKFSIYLNKRVFVVSVGVSCFLSLYISHLFCRRFLGKVYLITKTSLFKYTENFTTKKKQMKIFRETF